MSERTSPIACAIAGCGRAAVKRGWCQNHWYLWWKYGDPEGYGKRPAGLTLEEAFRWYMPGDPPAAPSPTEGCWLWSQGVNDFGYGRFRHEDKTHRAHIVSYRIHVGPVPDDAILRHTCHTPACVQPAHLIPGTKADNSRDMIDAGRSLRGSRNSRARLTEADVRAIRSSTDSALVLAARYGITRTTVYDIRSRRSWGWLD